MQFTRLSLVFSSLFASLSLLLSGCGSDSVAAVDAGHDAGALPTDAGSDAAIADDAEVLDDAGPLDAGRPSPDAGPPYPEHCENINPVQCLLPWPSSRYLVDDSTTLSGRRLEIPVEAMPRNSRRIPIDPELFRRFDGFSPATSIITAYPQEIDPSNLPDERHIEESLAASTTPTVLLDTVSAQLVPHFSEIDQWSYRNWVHRPLYIRPARRLTERRQYIVAIRNLRTPDGTPIEPSPYFRALRDNTPLPDAPDIEARRPHFEQLFARLEAAGIPRGTLIEAWDFETSSDESIWSDAVSMRDDAIRALEAEGAQCTITNVDENPRSEIWRRIEGTVRVPLFLQATNPSEQPECAGTTQYLFAHCRIVRDGSGRPMQNGWATVPFTLQIPTSVRARVEMGGEPGPILDYGHGLFGSRGESEGGTTSRTIERLGMVGVGIDWWGMSSDDVPRVSETLGEFSTFASTTERLIQGLINHVALHRSFRGACAALPELQVPQLDSSPARPAIDTTQTYYDGNSQGGIMGLSLAALAVDAERFSVGVGGMSYSIMIPRSTNWRLYGTIMQLGYPDPLTRALIMVMGQSQWDIAEPSTFVPHLLSDPLPCADDVCTSTPDTPRKYILFINARDDQQVPNVAADIAARTMGLAYQYPSPYTPWNIPQASGAMGAPLAVSGTEVDSVMVYYEIPGAPALPLGTRDPDPTDVDDDPHGGPRNADAAIEQKRLFLRPGGQVIQTCTGPCDADDL